MIADIDDYIIQQVHDSLSGMPQCVVLDGYTLVSSCCIRCPSRANLGPSAISDLQK